MSRKKNSRKLHEVDDEFEELPVRKKKKKKVEVSTDALFAETLEQVLRRTNIKNWDFLMIGDGSGSVWDRGAGWGCVTIERRTMERRVWAGAVTHGTVNFAEIMAYLQPLEWLASRTVSDRGKDQVAIRATRIHILTDSDYCRMTGNSKNRMMLRNAGLWSVFDVFARHGFVLNWHWIPRGSVGLNCYVDALSRMARLTLQDYNPVKSLREKDTMSGAITDINPADIPDSGDT